MKFSRLIVLCLIGIVIAGCTNSANTTQSQPNPVSSDADDFVDTEAKSDTKTTSWPSEVPTAPNAIKFNYAKTTNNTYLLSYEIAGRKDYGNLSDEIGNQLKQVGWVATNEDTTVDSDTVTLDTYSKDTNSLTVTVSKADDSDNAYIAIIMGPTEQLSSE